MEDRMVERRTILLHLAGGLAGTVVAANTATDAAEHHGDATAQPVAPPPPQPKALDGYQRQMLASLAELMLPGSTAAGVVDLIDRVLAVESMPRRREFQNALGAFEREARERQGTRWVDLDPTAQAAILQRAAEGEESRPLPAPWQKGQPIDAAAAAPAPPATLRDHFTRLRTTVATAYFATEPGLRELGWRGRTGWTELPGCPHPDGAHD
jgi:hypothetical protein